MKTLNILIIIVTIFLSNNAVADSNNIFKGTIVGIDCFRGRVDCDSDMYKHAHVAFEPDFVLKINKKRHYMIQNVPYYLKQQLASKEVTIVGGLVKHNTTISVETIKMEKNGETLIVWSPAMKNKDSQKKDWLEKYEHDRKFYGN